jgi:hypothetical protein
MAQASGSNAQVIYGEESTYGTAASSGIFWKGATYGESFGGSTEELQSEAINASRSVQDTKAGNISVGGSIPFELSTVGMGTILKHLMGSNATTGAGPYTHTMKRGALPTGLTIEKGYTDITQYEMFTGCKIDSMALSLNPEGLVTGTFEFSGQDQAASGSSFDASPTDLGHTVIAHHEATTVEEGGGAAVLLGFELNIANNLDKSKYQVGSQYIASLPEGKGDCTGTVTFMFEDLTYYNKWLNETATSLDITLTDTASNTIRFYMPNVKYTGDGSPKIESAQGVVIALNWRAIYDATEATDVEIVLVNGEATI